MAEKTRDLPRVTRRRFLTSTALAAASLGVALPAPAILAATRRPLRLGAINSFSSVMAVYGRETIEGMKIYFDRIGWKIAGRPIELVQEDDEVNPQVGLQKMKKLVESDGVDIVFGPQASNVAMALLNYVQEKKVFFIASGAGTDAITWVRYPYLFRTSVSSWQLCQPAGQWFYDKIAKEAVLMASDYAAGHDVMRTFKSAYVAQGGKIAAEIYAPLGTSDYSAYLTDAASDKAPASYCMFTGSDAVRFVQQYAQVGLKKKMALNGFPSLVDATSLPAQGNAALGVRYSTHYTETLDNAANQRFVAEYRAKTKKYPSLVAEYGVVAAEVLDRALQATGGDTDRDKLSAAMVKVAFDAPRGPFRFDPVTHNPIENIYFCEIDNLGDHIGGTVGFTIKDVRDPGVKPSSA